MTDPLFKMVNGEAVQLSPEEEAAMRAEWAANAASVAVKSWTPLEFIERFTDAEQLAIVTAAQANPALRLFYDKLMASLVVKANEPRTVAGMQALVDAGLITAARRDEILGA